MQANDKIEENANINVNLASKLNSLLGVIFTSKNDEPILFDQLESSHRKQLTDTVTQKFKAAFTHGSSPIRAKNLIQLYLQANLFSRRDSGGCRASLMSYFETASACKYSDLQAIMVAAIIE